MTKEQETGFIPQDEDSSEVLELREVWEALSQPQSTLRDLEDRCNRELIKKDPQDKIQPLDLITPFYSAKGAEVDACGRVCRIELYEKILLFTYDEQGYLIGETYIDPDDANWKRSYSYKQKGGRKYLSSIQVVFSFPVNDASDPDFRNPLEKKEVHFDATGKPDKVISLYFDEPLD